MPHSGGSTTTTPSLSSSYQEQRPRSNCSSPSKPYFNGCDIHIPVKSKFNISPNTLRKRKLIEPPTTDYYYKAATTAATTDSLDSLNEDDSTLKEIMGKFDDISYTYDKETDILSDSSDHTQCQEEHSDFEDTGQEAEDEYEEEIDFIDKHAVSVTESIKYKNMGSCEYYEEKEKQEVELPQPQPQQISRASLKQRKRLRRTRKVIKSITREIIAPAYLLQLPFRFIIVFSVPSVVLQGPVRQWNSPGNVEVSVEHPFWIDGLQSYKPVKLSCE